MPLFIPMNAFIKEAYYLNKKFCTIYFNNFCRSFFFMYKKHELQALTNHINVYVTYSKS